MKGAEHRNFGSNDNEPDIKGAGHRHTEIFTQPCEMKIAYLLGSLNRGGTETLLLDCFRNAKEAAFPFIGIYRKEGTLSDAFQATGVPLIQCVPKAKIDAGYFIRLRKQLLKNNISIVHAQQPLDAVYARLATLGTGIKVALTFHGYDLETSQMEKWLIRWIIRRTDLNIFVSKGQQEYYRQHYLCSKNKTTTVHNGIFFNKLDNAEINAFRKEWRITNHTLLLGSVGNFVVGRDQLTICKFLRLLADTGADFRFLFVGSQNSKEAWRYEQCVEYCGSNGLSDKVIFTGSRPDVPQILAQLDAFVYSTDHDTFGIAVIEAMASGIPVFVNDWKVMLEITDNGRYAHLYKTKDPADLLTQFQLFIANKETYKQEAALSAAWAREQYSIEKHLAQLNKIYNTMRN